MDENYTEIEATSKVILILKKRSACLIKSMKAMKSKITKKFIVISMIVMIFAVCSCIAYSSLTNNYYTPIRTYEKFCNEYEYSVEEVKIAYGNGLGRSEWKKVFSILHNSDLYMDAVDEYNDRIIDTYESRLDEYGEDFVIKYTELAKTELTKSELRNYRSELQECINMYDDLVDESDDFDSSDWSAVAEELDLTKAESRELVAQIRKFVEEVGRIEITEGYELEMEMTVSGSLLEDIDTKDITIIVLKVNGRWIAYDHFTYAFSLISF